MADISKIFTTRPVNLSKNFLQVKILSPRQELFKGTALSVSSINSAGTFDILPEHSNFVTLVLNHPIIIKLVNEDTLNYTFPLAVIYTRKDIVTIFTDIQLETLTS